MKPLNFPALHERMTAILKANPPREATDAEIYNLLHGALATAAQDGESVNADDLCRVMIEILGLCAMKGWHLGKALIDVTVPTRRDGLLDLVMEAHIGIGLAYGASVEPDGVAPSFFLAVAFRHLLTLCERIGAEPADAFEETLSRMSAS
jgi:hypothetical protein